MTIIIIIFSCIELFGVFTHFWHFGLEPKITLENVIRIILTWRFSKSQQHKIEIVLLVNIRKCAFQNTIVMILFSAVVGFKCPNKVPNDSVAAKFWPYPRFPVPGDCHRFITCVHGHPRLIGCGHDHVFDPHNLVCEEPEHVPQCGGGNQIGFL